ncbi:t-SNARE [Mycena rebaudengoi]|nr:t-SNARE [Mycena rebaudengoi]
MSFQNFAEGGFSVAASSSGAQSPTQRLRTSLSLLVFKIDANTQGILALVGQMGSQRDTPSLRDRIRDLTETTRAMVAQASSEVNKLAAMSPTDPALNKIIKDLEASIQKFQAAQNFSLSQQKMALSRQIQAPYQADDTRSETLIDDASETQTLVHGTEDAYRDAEIQDRQAAIEDIQTSVEQIAQIFAELGRLVDEQADDMILLEDTTRRVAHDLERGADELSVAQRYQRRSGRTCLAVIFGIVCAVVIVAVLL